MRPLSTAILAPRRRLKGSPLVSGLLLASLVGTAVAGPTFEEVPDAGSTPATAQPATGTTALARIKGELTAAADVSDFEDMFLICITDPEQFTATVNPVGTNFDTRLWLFKLNGKGLLSNDNSPPGSPTVFSTLGPNATDGSGAALLTPGLYYLAISTKDSIPLSVEGAIFVDATPNNTEISGPDGPGGNQPIDSWFHGGNQPGGTYTIDLTGAKPFAPPCDVLCPPSAAIDADAYDCVAGDTDPNGGCFETGNPQQMLGAIAPGAYRAVCGTTGVEYSRGAPANKDRDFYRIDVAAPGYLWLSLVTETPGGVPAPNARITLFDGTDCDRAVQLGTITAPACPLTLGPIAVSAGPHVIIVTLDGALPAGPACPTEYVLYVDERPTTFDACGVPTSLPCDTTHPLPGCDDPLCCDLVCSVDPACCDEGWDATCVTGTFALCTGYTCLGDLDGDGIVGGSDLAILLGQWGGGATSQANLNGDGTVNAADLAILLGAWGGC